jgi:hypothetical protein
MCNDVIPDRGNDGTGWTVESSRSYETLTSASGPSLQIAAIGVGSGHTGHPQ